MQKLSTWIFVLLSGFFTGGKVGASTWSHTVNSHGVCVIHNENLGNMPYIAIGLMSENVEIGVWDPDWKSLREGVKYEVDWIFSSDDIWNMNFTGHDVDGDIVLRGVYENDAGHEFLLDLSKFDSYQISFKNKVIAEQTLAGSMKAYFQAMECLRKRDPFSDSDDSGNSKESEIKDPFAT